MISKPVEISQQNFSSDSQFPNTSYLFALSSLTFLNDSLKLFPIISNISWLEERKPFVIPFRISNYLINSGFFYLHSGLSRQKYLSIPLVNDISIDVKSLYRNQQLRPALNIHARNYSIKTQTKCNFSVFWRTKSWRTLWVLNDKRLTLTYGVSSCH